MTEFKYEVGDLVIYPGHKPFSVIGMGIIITCTFCPIDKINQYTIYWFTSKRPWFVGLMGRHSELCEWEMSLWKKGNKNVAVADF